MEDADQAGSWSQNVDLGPHASLTRLLYVPKYRMGIGILRVRYSIHRMYRALDQSSSTNKDGLQLLPLILAFQ